MTSEHGLQSNPAFGGVELVDSLVTDVCLDVGKRAKGNRAACLWTCPHHRPVGTCSPPIFPEIISTLFMRPVPFCFSTLENTPTVQTCVCHGNTRPPPLPLFATPDAILVATNFLKRRLCDTSALPGAYYLQSAIEMEGQERSPSCPQKTDLDSDTLSPKPVH